MALEFAFNKTGLVSRDTHQTETERTVGVAKLNAKMTEREFVFSNHNNAL